MIQMKSVICGMSRVSLALLAACALAGGASAATTTVQNMQAAYNGESNAHSPVPRGGTG